MRRAAMTDTPAEAPAPDLIARLQEIGATGSAQHILDQHSEITRLTAEVERLTAALKYSTALLKLAIEAMQVARDLVDAFPGDPPLELAKRLEDIADRGEKASAALNKEPRT
jgi:hypothetical protein